MKFFLPAFAGALLGAFLTTTTASADSGARHSPGALPEQLALCFPANFCATITDWDFKFTGQHTRNIRPGRTLTVNYRLRCKGPGEPVYVLQPITYYLVSHQELGGQRFDKNNPAHREAISRARNQIVPIAHSGRQVCRSRFKNGWSRLRIERPLGAYYLIGCSTMPDIGTGHVGGKWCTQNFHTVLVRDLDLGEGQQAGTSRSCTSTARVGAPSYEPAPGAFGGQKTFRTPVQLSNSQSCRANALITYEIYRNQVGGQPMASATKPLRWQGRANFVHTLSPPPRLSGQGVFMVRACVSYISVPGERNCGPALRMVYSESLSRQEQQAQCDNRFAATAGALKPRILGRIGRNRGVMLNTPIRLANPNPVCGQNLEIEYIVARSTDATSAVLVPDRRVIGRKNLPNLLPNRLTPDLFPTRLPRVNGRYGYAVCIKSRTANQRGGFCGETTWIELR